MTAGRGQLEFRILGPLEVVADGSSLALGGEKQRAVLAVLLLNANEVVSSERLIEQVWGEQQPESAATALQVYVSRLRKLLEPDRAKGEASRVLVTRPPGYLLSLEESELDLARFQRLAGQARSALGANDPEQACALFAEALSVWRGPPLADLGFETFGQVEIPRLEELRLSCLEERIEAELACGRHAELVGELEALVREHPLRERVRGQLILALYRSGRQAEALDAYQSARDTMVEELGIDPSPELQTLHKQILNQDEALAAPQRPRQRGATVRLPAPATSLIGREQELANLLALLSDDVRLVTIAGPGGVGKTRLALAAAAEVAATSPDEVCWVDLQALRDSTLVIPMIAQVLDAKGEVETAIGERRLLLCLDNLEQLLDAGPELARLLTACPNLRLLTTSREPLHLYGEHEYPLGPLTERDATDLFNARARAVRPDFSATQGELADHGEVREICRRLDHLPLAIELAAARVKIMPPAVLLERLEQRLPLLTEGPRDLPQRQRTLTEAIAWSYDLLSADEQRLFASLSVFAGGCTLEAAEEVAQADLETLESLVDKSLLRHADGRFWMLETIREYAADVLDRKEVEALRLRHLAFFTAFAEQAHRELRGPNKAEWVERVQADLENARAALAWTPAAADPGDLQLRLAAALRLFWDSVGSVGEGLRWIEQGLARVQAPSAQLRYDAHLGASAFASQLGDFDKAFAYDALALAAAREMEDPVLEATALMRTAIDARRTDELSRARELYEQALALAEEAGDEHLAGAVTHNLGDLALAERDFERAHSLFRKAFDGARARSDPHETAYALCNLALASFKLDRARVVEYLRDALTIVADLSWPFGLVYSLELAGDALAAEDPDGAVRLLAKAEAMRLELELPLDPFEQGVHDESVASVLQALGADKYSALSEVGRAMSESEAIGYALDRLHVPSRLT
jgi:predicted ATPase/DNA-binding SARP family transcriptional activator